MAEQPLVCICIPTYNAAETVRETLLSILSQTYRNLIVHISDNASTDDTLKIIGSFDDPRLCVHSYSENIGGEGNFTRCIQLAEGKYTAIFHADDLYEREIVERQVAFLEAFPEAGAVFTEASLIDAANEKIGKICLPSDIASINRSGLYDFETIFKMILRHGNFFICSSFMARTQIYQQEIKVWRGGLFGSSADLDVWLRILKNHSIGHLSERLMRYRISATQWSEGVRHQIERADFFLVIEHYLLQDDVRGILSSSDLRNYARLDRRDRVMRAVNCFLSARSDEAKILLYDFCSWDAWKAGAQTKRGFGVLLAGIYLRFLLLFHLENTGRITLKYLKRFMRK